MEKVKNYLKEVNKITVMLFIFIIILLELFSVGIAAMVTKYQNDQTFWGSMFYQNEKLYGRIFAFTTAFILVAIFAKLAKDNQEA